tara:strand:+ start:3334 stop:3777 length:444 start_codon:yes stop_codon:yes gene_type:complete
MFSLENRIKTTNLILDKSRQFLKNLNENEPVSGLVLFIFHWLFLGIPLVIILVGKINFYFGISIIIWVIVYILHFYFNGCILTKLERKLFNDKKWYGPWTFLILILDYYNGVKITKELINNVFFCWGILLSIFTFIRLFYFMTEKKN